MEYYITYEIRGSFTAKVDAKSKQEADDLAMDVYCDADFGILENTDIEGYRIL